MLSWTRESNEEGMGRRRQHSGGLALASDSDSRAGPIQHLFRPCHFPRRFCQAFSTPVILCYSRQTRKRKFEAKACKATIEMSSFFHGRNVWVNGPGTATCSPCSGLHRLRHGWFGLSVTGRWARDRGFSLRHSHRPRRERVKVERPSVAREPNFPVEPLFHQNMENSGR